MSILAFLWIALVSAATSDANSAAKEDTSNPEVMIPSQFQGVWDADLKACAYPASDMRGYVGPQGFRFQDTLGGVQKIKFISPTEIEMLVSGSTEGERWTELMRWELTPTHDTLVFKNNPSAKPRVRCPHNASK